MEEKEKKEKIDELQENYEKGSTNCVMDLSIDGGGDEKESPDKGDKGDKEDKEEGNTNVLNKSFDNFTKNLNLKDNFENILDFDENIFTDDNKNRSKTVYVKNINITSSQIK